MDHHDEDSPFTGEYLDFAEMSRDELQSKLFELLTLVETSRELLRAQDADDVARRVLLSSIGVLGASSACVLLREKETGRVRLVHELGLDPRPELALDLDPGIVEAFRHEGVPRPFRADEMLAQGAAVSFLKQHGDALATLDADVICPLVGRRDLLGFLVLGSRLLAEGYTARDLDLFASLAELYVLALERAPIRNASVGATGRMVRSRPSPPPAGVHPDIAELRDHHPPLRKILGESEAMARLFADLVEIADSRATVLIQGESGTGKELVAKAIHEMSRRRTGPLEVVDCSSIPRELIESELFGHVRGAFTGAVRDRRGAFDLAHHGTLFLDEIGDMTLSSQTRLLRVLQEGKLRPVGGEKTHSVDVRVIAATNVDLRQAVRDGRFRKDLFYRIQVFPVWLPPLRDRDGDVEVLTRAFLRRFYADDGLDEPRIEAAVIERLSAYRFPGNVRELQNIAEALAIRSRAEGRVTRAQLDEVFRSMNIESAEIDPWSASHRSSADTTAVDGGSAPSPRPQIARVSPSSASSTGEFVLHTWRECGFNLLEASRRLRARRLEGQDVPVVDRAQLSHYLDGEILRAFLQCADLGAVVDALAAGSIPRARARRRIERVVARLANSLEAGAGPEAFPRLPDEYRGVLEELCRRGPDWVRRGASPEDRARS